MGIFDKLFGTGGSKKKADEPLPAPSPWDREPSIYDCVKSWVEEGGGLDSGMTLPDEERAQGGSQIRWAAGAKDGVATHHMQSSGDAEATALLNLVVEYCNAPSAANKLKVYERVIRSGAVTVIDPFIEGLGRVSGVSFSRLYDLARSFAMEATDREPVKLGIALLGLFAKEEDQVVFRTLGRHDEFTLFCVVAMGNAVEEPEAAWWDLAQSVHGWGRIHVVERLAATENLAIKNWLLREGYRNEVMYEYLAYPCAVGGGLLAALRPDGVDAQLLSAAGEIIGALLRGGPAADIDCYDDGAAVVEHYLRHLTPKASTIAEFLTVAAIRDFLSRAEADWEDRRTRGWTPELRSSLREQCNGAMNQPLWRQLASDGLESSDPRTFDDANQAASVLGIDSRDCHWRRLQADPLDPARWFHAVQTCGAEHVADIVALAQRALPLEAIGCGPAGELGLSGEYQPHQCLGYVLQGLQTHPGYGRGLIEAGLKSPVVSNRHAALRALAAWGKTNWPAGMEATLTAAMAREPVENIRGFIQRVIDGEDLS